MDSYAVLCLSTLPLWRSTLLYASLRPSTLVRPAPLLCCVYALPLYAALRLDDAFTMLLWCSTLLSAPDSDSCVSKRGSEREVVGPCWQRAWGMFPQPSKRVGREGRMSRLDQCEGAAGR
jgi:hypothetical protein